MNKYLVTIPFTGTLSVEIEANSKKEALKLANEVDTLDGDNVNSLEFYETEFIEELI